MLVLPIIEENVVSLWTKSSLVIFNKYRTKTSSKGKIFNFLGLEILK